MITKDEAKNFALKIKAETGKFPVVSMWNVKDGYPCGFHSIRKLFDGSYNNFRDYCNEPILQRTEELSLEWFKKNSIIDENQCWNWKKSLYHDGYGRIGWQGRDCTTHRVAYELFYGDILNDLVVRHKCDNRKCCNPDHLELGTQSDNTLDNVIRNKNYEPKHNSILSTEVKKLTSIKEKIDFYLKNSTITNINCYIPTLKKPLVTGYYHIVHKGKHFVFHRLILADKLNKQYDEVDIARHTCNNKSCINPDHLIEGTLSDNALDSRNYSKAYKLTIEKVMEIKRDMVNWDFNIHGSKMRFDYKWSQQFNVGRLTISDIRLGRSWKDI